MSFVIAAPSLVESAATDLAGIRSSLAEAASTAAFPTTGIASAAQDEVSIAVATLFGNVGQEFQALNASAQAFHAQFVELMNTGAGAYAAAEAANAGQTLVNGGIVGNIGGTLGGSLGGMEAAAGQLGPTVGDYLNGAVVALQADVNAVSSAILGAPAALSGAVQTGGQAISQAATGFGNQFQALAAGGVPGLITSANVFANQIAGPYEALVNNTVANLQSIGNTFMADPFPFAHQLITNQIGYAQTIATAIGNGLVNLPTELANLPASIQAAVQGLLSFHPLPYLQGFINNTITYTQTIATSLQSAANDLVTGVQTLPPAFLMAFQDLLAGNNSAAYAVLNQALVNAFLPGFTVPETAISGVFDVVPIGVLGDLQPILNIPGQLAQDFTNLLPAGTIPMQISQNATNLISGVTNFGTTLNLNAVKPILDFGIPLQLVIDGIGAPANALSALNSSANAFVGALQTGNASAAAAALLDAPAVVANGFLNGSTLIALPPATLDYLGLTLPSTTYLSLGGLLTPLSFPTIVASFMGSPLPLPVGGGTPVGGLIPGLLSFPSQLAADITP